MLRAGPSSDERIARLVNRRLVPFVFDLLGGALADAKAFVVAQNKELGRRIASNEPLMIMRPDGRVLGETIRYDDTRHILGMLRRVLRRHDEFDRPREDEKTAQGPIAKAEILIDLCQVASARALLESVEPEGEEGRLYERARYMLARLARMERGFDEMEEHLKAVKGKEHEDDVRMERAYALWFDKDYEALAAKLRNFPKDSQRYTEARYYEGLAWHLLGKKKKARRIWKDTIEAHPEDPWIYRADRVHWSSKAGPARAGTFMISGGRRRTPLGRISYLAWRNPELNGPLR